MKVVDFEYIDRFKGTRLYMAGLALTFLKVLAKVFFYSALGVFALAAAKALPAIW
jgi:hypothetical protein